MGTGWSIHKSNDWRGQYERVGRWHTRIHLAANAGTPDLEDFLFAFFQNCYHLREWTLKASAVSRSDIDKLFNASRELRVCRDICNGTKHPVVDHPSVDPDFSIGREYDSQVPSGFRYFIIAGGNVAEPEEKPRFMPSEKVDLLTLADQCLAVWKSFLPVEEQA